MKSDGAVLQAFFAFALLVVVSGLSVDEWSIESNATGRAKQQDNRCILHLDDIYRVTSRGVDVEKLNYCANRACPNWKCVDDSAIIYGTCCGCPNIFGDDVPVLCNVNLKCPHLMKDLCNDYNFMILCCCSRINNNYYNYNN